eukprot:353414-Chlamydomonas_euryale.AAC.19
MLGVSCQRNISNSDAMLVLPLLRGMKKALKRLPRACQQQQPHGIDSQFMAAEATMVNDFVAEIGRLNARRTVEQAEAAATLARLRHVVKHPNDDIDERRQVRHRWQALEGVGAGGQARATTRASL